MSNQENLSNKKQIIKSRPLSLSLFSSTTKKTSNSSEHPSKRWGHSAILYNNNMIIFGGRHLQRSLSTTYLLDFTTFNWSKIEPEGPPPSGRDSHSAILYNNYDMIIFGGNGCTTKFNDLWDFNISEYKWTKLATLGKSPCARDGHLSALIHNKYMVIYSGLNDKYEVINDLFLFDFKERKWIECDLINANLTEKRDGQSCCLVGDTMYLFGGQGPEEDKYSNELLTITFDIDPTFKSKPKATISLIEINNSTKPQERTSHSCVVYKDQYLIITGGEAQDKKPLDDIWLYDIKKMCYTEIELNGKEKIEGRFCHCSIISGDILAIYGGMESSDITLDNLALINIEYNQSKRKRNVEILSNNKKKKLEESNDNDNNEDFDFAYPINRGDVEDFSTDTNDLINMNFFSFEEIKKNYLNNMMTWNFLKQLSAFYKWPIGCIGNFIKNSLKDYVSSRNIYIDYKKTTNSEIYISIKDDGKGITSPDFNGIMYSFIKNQNKDLNYFQYGFSMKASALRLGDSFLLISKTGKEASIGLISKRLQQKIKENDYILTPIINYRIEKKETNKLKYIAKSNFPRESLNLILESISFLFQTEDDLMNYFDSFDIGTHIYLFDLRKKNLNKDNILNEDNYELIFNEEENDIWINEDYDFNEELKRNIIDFSLKKYLNFIVLKTFKDINIYLLEKKLDWENPYYNIKLLSNLGNNIKKTTSLNYSSTNENEKINCLNIEGKEGIGYQGILFNENFIDSITSNTNIGVEDIKEKDYLNGILIYKDGILVKRLNQHNFGDFNFFVKKIMNVTNKISNNNDNDVNNNIFGLNQNNNYFCSKIFKKNGYIDLPSNAYELTFNGCEIKDQALFGFFYNKVKALLQKIEK